MAAIHGPRVQRKGIASRRSVSRTGRRLIRRGRQRRRRRRHQHRSPTTTKSPSPEGETAGGDRRLRNSLVLGLVNLQYVLVVRQEL
jgi:hypothetical protein